MGTTRRASSSSGVGFGGASSSSGVGFGGASSTLGLSDGMSMTW